MTETMYHIAFEDKGEWFWNVLSTGDAAVWDTDRNLAQSFTLEAALANTHPDRHILVPTHQTAPLKNGYQVFQDYSSLDNACWWASRGYGYVGYRQLAHIYSGNEALSIAAEVSNPTYPVIVVRVGHPLPPADQWGALQEEYAEAEVPDGSKR